MSDLTCECIPTQAFEHHRSSKTNIPLDAPLFAFEMVDSSWSPMRCSWIVERWNEIWHEEGCSSDMGHGFHIGGTMHLLLLGVNPWIVMVQGCWSSQAFLGYWQRCKKILSLFIGFSFQSCESILTTMSTKNCLMGKQ